MTDDAIRLLEVLHGRGVPGWTELRMINRKGSPPRQEWFEAEQLDSAAERAIEFRDRYDVYFGVLPRTRREGTKDAIDTGAVVWVDVDSTEALLKLMGFEVPASAIGERLAGLPPRLLAFGRADPHRDPRGCQPPARRALGRRRARDGRLAHPAPSRNAQPQD
jgi:hypothetical protein